MEKITKNMIAPCGIDCAVCRAHVREKNVCPGCNNGPTLPSCKKCKIKLCDKKTGEHCFACAEFPCEKMRKLDKRYREKYGMSEIENLEFIRDHGIDKFLESEKKKWLTDEGIICVHDRKVYK